ncbi:MAG TPA: magnesium chelatase domain-containing protein, partial [Solirubrobacteraceae bacterium]|nr:magnesium chelatase domain-containing protein [Solirubrobacteraceae bacterium]
MLARVATFAIEGLDPRPVSVEVDIRPGLPAFTVVGLADAAVREARERVRAAVLNSGFEFPLRRITANLAPAHLRKIGPGFDLALATAVLAASGQVPCAAVAEWAIFGELSLGGELRGCRGALAVAEGARQSGLRGLILPREHAAEAALVDGVEIAAVESLREVFDFLTGRTAARIPERPGAGARRRPRSRGRARPGNRHSGARDRRRRGAQPATRGAARYGKDDARSPAALDHAAANA